MLWVNGDFVESGAQIDAADRGLLLGDGVFETIYVENGRCGFFREHMRRLKIGLDTLQIPAPASIDGLEFVIAALADRHGLARGRAAARVTVTRGPSARGLQFARSRDAPTIIASLAPLAATSNKPLGLFISTRPRFSGASTSRFKAIGGYIENMLAHNEALEAGAEEAVMLNELGRVACAAAANIFVAHADKVATPPAGEGALPGVVRGVILREARKLGVRLEERAIACDELLAGEIFLTNSLIGVRPAVLADASPPRKGGPARRRILKTLQVCYVDCLQRDLAKRRRK